MTTPLRHVYLSNDAETVSWRGNTLCLLCYEQFGLPQVIEDGDPEHHEVYHVVLPEKIKEASLVKGILAWAKTVNPAVDPPPWTGPQ